MYKTILVPIDTAHIETGKSMIDVAKEQSDENTRIILLHVIEDIPSWVAVELPKSLLENSRQSTKEQIEAIAHAASIRADVEIRSGHPYKNILDKAKEEEADLIIIASHKPGLQDYLLGSTAAKVVRHARCSVLVVR
jgi:universal stress protein F